MRLQTLVCSALFICLASSLRAAPAPLYILTGQSNSLGAVKGSPASPDMLKRYQSSALLWNGNMNRDSGQCFETQRSWQPLNPQLPRYAGTLCMGPEYGFAAIMERRIPSLKGKLHIVKASLDGGGNHYWLRGGNAYNTLTNNIVESMKGQALKIAGLLYLQGESDAGEEISAAATRFPAFVKNLRSDLQAKGIQTKGLTRCVLGQPANWHGRDKDFKGKTTADELFKLTRKNKNIGWVYTRDLTKITRGDNMGVHYDGASQITIGARFAYAMLALKGHKLSSIRNATPDIPLNSPEAWWNGKTPEAQDVAIWDVSSLHGEETFRGKLSLAGLLIEDPFAGSVTLAADSPQSTLALGARGIRLKEGNLLLKGGRLLATSDQTWSIGDSHTLQLQNVTIDAAGHRITIDHPERLQADGCQVLNGSLQTPGGASLSL